MFKSTVLSDPKASLLPATTKIALENWVSLWMALLLMRAWSVQRKRRESVAPITPLDAGQPGYGKYKGADILAAKIMVILLAKAEYSAVKGDLILMWSSLPYLSRRNVGFIVCEHDQQFLYGALSSISDACIILRPR